MPSIYSVECGGVLKRTISSAVSLTFAEEPSKPSLLKQNVIYLRPPYLCQFESARVAVKKGRKKNNVWD